MKKTLFNLLIFVLTIFIITPTYAFEIDKWDKVDMTLAATTVITSAIDWRQTKTIASNPHLYHEKNPILGRHPSNNDVDVYFAGKTLIILGIAHVLPSNWRKAFLGGVTIGNGYTIIQNNGLGITVTW